MKTLATWISYAVISAAPLIPERKFLIIDATMPIMVATPQRSMKFRFLNKISILVSGNM